MATNPSTPLYQGEHLDTVAGFPTLYKFSPADPSNPLLVFIPGAGHNARIAYGGHSASREDDFLAYWLNKLGYGLLALSYPLHSEPEDIMAPVAPGFRIRDWGRQAAETTKIIIDRHHLSRDVVLIAWSMGGRVVIPYVEAAEALGLTVELFVSLSATPGFAGARPVRPGIRQTSRGYAAFNHMPEQFLKHVHQQNQLNSHITIPDDVYRREYYGHTPVSLLGCKLGYSQEHGFVEDWYTSSDDAAVEKFNRWPLIASLHGVSILDARHVLADKATWAYIQVQQLVSCLESRGLGRLGDGGRWERLIELVHSRPEQMCARIGGSHFFFLGKQGARETADAIVEHLQVARNFRSALNTLLES